EYAFKGKRIKRGLFKHHNGLKSNADVNGSVNIGKKLKHDLTKNLTLKQLVKKMTRPIRFTFYQLQQANQFWNKLFPTGTSSASRTSKGLS
ncbi:MAG: hypothetical protein ACTSX6_03985, partial [Candidatus Heimdallarchaeaceae archaeon]